MEGLQNLYDQLSRAPKRPLEDKYADVSLATAPHRESAKPTAGLRDMARALIKYATVLEAGPKIDNHKMVDMIRQMSAIEPTAHTYIDAYRLNTNGAAFVTFRVMIEDSPQYESDLGAGSPVMRSLIMAVPVAALNAMFNVLLRNYPSGRSQVFRLDSRNGTAPYYAVGDAAFPVALPNDNPGDWGSGIQAVSQSGQYNDWMIVAPYTPRTSAACTKLFGRPATDTVTPIGQAGGVTVQRFMDKKNENAVAILLPISASMPVDTRQILLAANVSLVNTSLAITLPPLTGNTGVGALQSYYLVANRFQALTNLAFTIFSLYQQVAAFDAWRAAVTNGQLGLTAAMLASIGRQVEATGNAAGTGIHDALATADGTPFSDAAIRFSADTGITAFSNVILFGATTLTTGPMALVPPGGVVMGMADARTQLNQVDTRDVMRTPLAMCEVAMAISDDVRVWPDAVAIEFRTLRPADRDFFCLPAQWMGTPAPGKTLRELITFRADVLRADDALATALLGSLVMGAPSAGAYGQPMRLLMDTPQAQFLAAVQELVN